MNPKIFISHSTQDNDRFVKHFVHKLKNEKGFDVWADFKGLLPGDSLIDNIINVGIKNADVIIIILSQNSVNSKWVKEELNLSIHKKIKEDIKLIPIVIDDCIVPLYLETLLQIRIKSFEEYNEEFENICRAIEGKTEYSDGDPFQNTSRISNFEKDQTNIEKEVNINQSNSGNNNIQVANSTIHELYHNTKKIVRNIVKPDESCIDDSQAYEIKEKIKQLVDIDIKSGKYSVDDQKKRFPFWWNSFKKHFKITDYHLIKKSDYDVTMKWLIKMVAINKPKMRKNNPIEWRKQIYSSIYTKTKAIGLSKPELYSFTYDKLVLKKPIESLTELTDTNLKKLYQLIIRL